MNQSEEEIILSDYRKIRDALKDKATSEQLEQVDKAFHLAWTAHKDMRRRSGEPYIIHPLCVASIVLNQMNLGTTSVICALLHDVVEDNKFYTLDEIRSRFGETIANIIDGLTKIEDVSGDFIDSQQYENFRKILLHMCNDARVILIKLADRLHNMQTLASMPPEKQQKIASETTYFYAPLAHRLGLYKIKSELEDLSMKYRDPGSYQFIEDKIKTTEKQREEFTQNFIQPIRVALEEKGFKFEIFNRVKSIYSIWQKMTKKQIPFEEIYDLFAIRIVLDVDEEYQKSTCWSVYSIVTDIYKPKFDRLRDWITTPKTNGYQALHITVMSKMGRWVEVQIRSKSMEQIAENGFAAHWSYKNSSKSDERWVSELLTDIKDTLQKNEKDVGEMMDTLQMNFYPKEIMVFTPGGDSRKLPKKSTIIDFAYDISPDLGNYCIGAKVNNRLVPLSCVLSAGDQIEIIISKKQKVHEEWINIVVTAKAKEYIMEALTKERNNKIESGKATFKALLKQNSIELNPLNRDKLMQFTNWETKEDFYLAFYNGKITQQQIRQCFASYGLFIRFFNRFKTIVKLVWGWLAILTVDQAIRRRAKENPQSVLLGENIQEIKRTIAKCCNPVAGDAVIAFNVSGTEMVIHRSNCKEAIQFAARHGDRIVKAKWRELEQNVEFLAGIFIRGVDDTGIVHTITGVISKDFHVKCRSMEFNTSENIFEGKITLYIQNVEHLNKLMEQLRSLSKIHTVERINSNYERKQKQK